MKLMFNLTTSDDDLRRFPTRGDLERHMAGFDGVELMYFGEDTDGVIPPDRVVGLHMSYLPYWVDFWRGDTAALDREFGDRETMERYYGGVTRDAFLKRFRDDIAVAAQYNAEYMVFHTTDATIEETFTGRYRHSDKEVVDAVAEVLNEVFSTVDGSVALLMENLWQPGFRFTNPDITARLLDAVKHPNRGIMLDTGHLFHTDDTIASEEDGLRYINAMLSRHGDLAKAIRGVHLNQSVTGAYTRAVRLSPPAMERDYEKRMGQMFAHAFATDSHLPFTCKGVRELIERISPEYLTFEFITESLEQHREYLSRQRAALNL